MISFTPPLYFTSNENKFLGAVYTLKNNTDIAITRKSSIKEVEKWLNIVALDSVDLKSNIDDFDTGFITNLQNKINQIVRQLSNNGYNTSPLVKGMISNLNSQMNVKINERRKQNIESPLYLFLDNQIEILVSMRDKLKKNLKGKRTTQNGYITEEDVERARDYPINNLLQFNRSGFHNCIFHTENTPSMKYYSKTNTIYCHGCQKFSDSIGVYMHENKVDFVTAVRSLK